MADECQPAQDERPHKNFAQLGVSRHQRPQTVAADLKKFPCIRNPAAHQAALPRDHGDLACEPARNVGHYGVLARQVRLQDFHAPGKQHKEGDIRVVGLKQNLAYLNLPYLAAGTQTIDLRLSQSWKSLGTSI